LVAGSRATDNKTDWLRWDRVATVQTYTDIQTSLQRSHCSHKIQGLSRNLNINFQGL